MDILSEKKLLERLRKGDRDAQRRLYERFAPMMMAICHRYIPDRDCAEDVVQECFIKVFGKIGDFEPKGNGSLSAWLSRIAVNGAISWLRERKRMGMEPLTELEITEEEEPSYQGLSQADIQAAIRSLPDGYRLVLNMYVFERMSHAEIAAELGITEGTSASQLHRARNLLWKKLKSWKTGQKD